MLTDSGGFQVFSLAKLRKITEEGVAFSSHIDGRRIFLSPEDSIDIQIKLGADIIMAFDECVENPSPYDYVKEAAERTTRWLIRCKERWESHIRAGITLNNSENPPRTYAAGRACWGINQGGIYDDLRVEHMKRIAELDLPGYAVGGLAVGEEAQVMYHVLDVLEGYMPGEKPRYLMGVGTPENIIEGIARGIDFFDCVLPARNARHGHLFTWGGKLNLLNERFKEDGRPIDEACGCDVCKNHSRAYLRHLFKANEVLALRLGVMHNLYFYNSLMARIRSEIENGTFSSFRKRYTGVLDARSEM
jgi:queuine tRNA-ribosyltransferase